MLQYLKVSWAFHNLATDEPPYAAVEGDKSATRLVLGFSLSREFFFLICTHTKSVGSKTTFFLLLLACLA